MQAAGIDELVLRQQLMMHQQNQQRLLTMMSQGNFPLLFPGQYADLKLSGARLMSVCPRIEARRSSIRAAARHCAAWVTLMQGARCVGGEEESGGPATNMLTQRLNGCLLS